jgi:hypothetical protein
MLPWNTGVAVYDSERNQARYELLCKGSKETKTGSCLSLIPPLWQIVAEYAADVAYVKWRWKHWHQRKQLELMGPYTTGVCILEKRDPEKRDPEKRRPENSKWLQMTYREFARTPLRFREADLVLFRQPINLYLSELLRSKTYLSDAGDREIQFIKQEHKAVAQTIKDALAVEGLHLRAENALLLQEYQLRLNHKYYDASDKR